MTFEAQLGLIGKKLGTNSLIIYLHYSVYNRWDLGSLHRHEPDEYRGGHQVSGCQDNVVIGSSYKKNIFGLCSFCCIKKM